MPKIVLTPVTNLSSGSAVGAINENYDRIEAAFENVLSRDGSTPNQMEADIDMNSNDIINVDNVIANNIVVDGKSLIDNVELAVESAASAQASADAAGISEVNAAASAERAREASELADNRKDFATKASVEGADISPDITYLRTAGYYDVEDGGGALYTKVETEPTHSGKIQSADGAWWELRENIPTDAMFGTVRDGVTDDVVPLQALLDYAEQGPKKAKLVKGIRVSSQIKIGSNIEFFGDAGAVLKARDSLNSELLINKDGTNGNVGIDIHHISFDGNKNNQAASIKDLLRLNKCVDSKVHDCILYDGIWSHINVNTGTRVHIYRNRIYGGNGHGVVLRTSTLSCRVEDNDIYDLGPANGVDNGAGTTVFAYGVILFDGSCQDNWILLNRILNTNGHGIYAGGFAGDENYHYNKVFFNIISNSGSANTTKSHNGIWWTSGIGNEICDNTVRNSGVDGIKLNTNCERNIVARNYVSACGRHGIVVDDGNFNHIAGNHCFNNGQSSTGNGISIGAFGASQKNNVIDGNWCYDNQAVATQSYGIRENSTANSSDYNDIRNNQCLANTQSVQILTAGEHTKLSNNKRRDAAGVYLETITVTGTQTLPISASNVLINISGATRTITLPTASNIPDNYEVLLVDIGGNLATFNAVINPSSGFTINGTTSFTMNVNNQRVTVKKIPGEKRFITF